MPGNDLRGAAEPMGREAWGSRVLRRLLHPHYSLLLRSETDCKAVLFFSRAAFCCCETESKRDTKNSCHPRVTPVGPGQELGGWPPREKAGSMAKGIRLAEPGAKGMCLEKQAGPLWRGLRPRAEGLGCPVVRRGVEEHRVRNEWNRCEGTTHSLPSPPTLCPPCQLTFCLTLVQLARVSLQRLWIVTLQAGRVG